MPELDALESRVRQVEIRQAEYSQNLGHIFKSLDELKSLVRISVELQERMINHRDAIDRAFSTIKSQDKTISTQGQAIADLGGEVSKYVNRAKGALWITGIGWGVLIVVVGMLWGGT